MLRSLVTCLKFTPSVFELGSSRLIPAYIVYGAGISPAELISSCHLPVRLVSRGRPIHGRQGRAAAVSRSNIAL